MIVFDIGLICFSNNSAMRVQNDGISHKQIKDIFSLSYITSS